MSKPEGSTGGEGMVSDEIKAFLNFINESKKLYAYAVDRVTEEEKRQMDLIHAIEFENSCKERSKLSTKLHGCRLDRRRYKDILEEREEIVKFFQDPQHKKTLDQLTQLLGKVRKVEKYHSNRTYYPRVKRGDSNGRSNIKTVPGSEKGNCTSGERDRETPGT